MLSLHPPSCSSVRGTFQDSWWGSQQTFHPCRGQARSAKIRILTIPDTTRLGSFTKPLVDVILSLSDWMPPPIRRNAGSDGAAPNQMRRRTLQCHLVPPHDSGCHCRYFTRSDVHRAVPRTICEKPSSCEGRAPGVIRFPRTDTRGSLAATSDLFILKVRYAVYRARIRTASRSA